jgi:hypothetical protein
VPFLLFSRSSFEQAEFKNSNFSFSSPRLSHVVLSPPGATSAVVARLSSAIWLRDSVERRVFVAEI